MLTKYKTHSLFQHSYNSSTNQDKMFNDTFQHQSSKKQSKFPLEEFIDFSNRIKSNRRKKTTCLENFLSSQKTSYEKHLKSNISNQQKQKIPNGKRILLCDSPLYKQNSAKNQNKICQSPDGYIRKQNQKVLQSLRLQNQKYRRMIKENHFLKQDKQTKIKPFSIFEFDGHCLPFQIKKTTQKLQNTKKNFEDIISCSLSNSFIFEQNEEKTFEANTQVIFAPKKQDFQKIKYLGKGNFGEVNLVRHKRTNFICAMKQINKSFIKQQKVQHQISRQIRIHQSLKHLNIIAFYGFFDDQSNIYMLIQYATGGQLFKRLKQSQRMPEAEIVPIINDAIDGLRMIHKLGYIHRDLKPENIIFQFGIGKICDMGWAVQCKQNQTRKSYCGTPLYLPPEMIKKQNYDSGADIWSVGILTYQLLVGKIPFNIWSQYDLMQIVERQIKFPTSYVDISGQCMDFIRKCLDKDPTKRIKLQQLASHQFLKRNYEKNYFNIQIYDMLNILF